MLGTAAVQSVANDDVDLLLASRDQLDPRDRAAALAWMKHNRPELVLLIAARVGGIQANIKQPAAFLFDNLQIQSNVIDGAFRTGVKKLVFVATNCCYPAQAPQPIPEEALLSGALDDSTRELLV